MAIDPKKIKMPEMKVKKSNPKAVALPPMKGGKLNPAKIKGMK